MTTEYTPLFAVGDVVYLKSGSPALTVVESVSDTQVNIVWFGFEVSRDFFPEAALTYEKPDKLKKPEDNGPVVTS